MSLPSLVIPTYEVKLLTVSKPVTFRPYLVKEEKILLIAQQSEDPKEVERAVKQIATNCTDGTVNVDKLASFDLEYLYLQLRAKSVNNVLDIQYECKNKRPETLPPDLVHKDGLCHALVPITIKLDEIQVVVPEGHTNTIMLDDKIGVTLKYPTADSYAILSREGADVFDLLGSCLETVFTASGEVHEIAESSPAELQAFVESLTVPQVDKIKRFFETMPSLSHTFTFACSKCGYTEEITLRGLQDFFG
jgi:hypothetical protein